MGKVPHKSHACEVVNNVDGTAKTRDCLKSSPSSPIIDTAETEAQPV